MLHSIAQRIAFTGVLFLSGLSAYCAEVPKPEATLTAQAPVKAPIPLHVEYVKPATCSTCHRWIPAQLPVYTSFAISVGCSSCARVEHRCRRNEVVDYDGDWRSGRSE